jgi:hypothetical protein
MNLRLLCIWLVFCSLLSLLMHVTMNLKVYLCQIRTSVGTECRLRRRPVRATCCFSVPLYLSLTLAVFDKLDAKRTRSTHGKLTSVYKENFFLSRAAASSVFMYHRCRPLYDEHCRLKTPCIMSTNLFLIIRPFWAGRSVLWENECYWPTECLFFSLIKDVGGYTQCLLADITEMYTY